jgi:hypothetical protein
MCARNSLQNSLFGIPVRKGPVERRMCDLQIAVLVTALQRLRSEEFVDFWLFGYALILVCWPMGSYQQPNVVQYVVESCEVPGLKFVPLALQLVRQLFILWRPPLSAPSPHDLGPDIAEDACPCVLAVLPVAVGKDPVLLPFKTDYR